jgi:tripartite-type tricarboxylate transporter receptor subunit TctC
MLACSDRGISFVISAIFRGAALTTLLAASHAAAQNFPTKALRYIVPQAPGGSSDTLARVIVPRLAEFLQQPVVIDNRPGATGIIGSEIVARAPADGHTLLQAATSHATNPAVGAKLPYDTQLDFAPVTLLSQQPNLWIAHPSLPVRDIQGLVALARAKPGQLDFASSGTGGSQHLAGELLNVMARIKLTHVPYKGSPPALIDVLGGRVAVMVSTIAPAMPMVKSARLRALAITSAQRSRAVPQVPTVAESGIAGYEAISWQGVLAPGGTPRNVVQRLNGDLRKVLALAEPQRQLAEQGYEPLSGTPEDFANTIQSEITKWTRVVQASGIKIK